MSLSHVEEKGKRSTKEKNPAASIALLRDKSCKYTSGIAMAVILVISNKRQQLFFSEIQVQARLNTSDSLQSFSYIPRH